MSGVGAASPCARSPYLLPEQQGRGQDAQDSQEADEAKKQEVLGALRGLSVACVWVQGREAETLVAWERHPPPPNPTYNSPPPGPPDPASAEVLLPIRALATFLCLLPRFSLGVRTTSFAS